MISQHNKQRDYTKQLASCWIKVDKYPGIRTSELFHRRNICPLTPDKCRNMLDLFQNCGRGSFQVKGPNELLVEERNSIRSRFIPYRPVYFTKVSGHIVELLDANEDSVLFHESI